MARSDPLLASSSAASGDLRAHAYPVGWRLVVGTLVALGGASLPAILLAVLLATDPPITPPVLVGMVIVCALLPALAAWLLRRVFAATLAIDGAFLVVRRRHMRLEIPWTAIARVAPWSVPLPGPGFSLWLRSGRRFGYGFEADDPLPLVLALAEGGLDAARPATHHPTLVYAHAKRALTPRGWDHLVAKFGLFAFPPAAVLFNAHQHIAYGGALGQYYLEGLGPHLATFGVYWITTSIYLVLYASIWRGLAEAVALSAAWLSPAHASGVRRAVELVCQVAYYAGVPLLLLLRFLP